MKTPPRRQILADLLLLGVSAIWGGTFVMVKDAVSGYPVLHFLTIRFTLASVALLLFSARRIRTLRWRDVGAGALIGLFLFGGYALQTLGLQYTSASKAGLITGLSVVMVPILSGALTHRKPGAGPVLGVILATVGLAMLTLEPSDGLAIETGDLILFGCALGFALHIVTVSIFAPRVDALALAWVQVTVVAILSAVVALANGTPWALPTSQVWFSAGFTGVLATALAFALQNIMQQFTTPTHTALIFAAEPVFAAVFGVLLAGEALLPRGIAGGILIVLGTVSGEIRWTDGVAQRISRWLSPLVLTVPVLVCVAWGASGGWVWNLAWSGAVWVLAIVVPHVAQQRRGSVATDDGAGRGSRLRRIVLVLPTVVGPGAALLLALSLKAPGYAVWLSVVLLIGRAYRLVMPPKSWVSAHVAWAAAAGTALTAVLGVAALPSLLLAPLTAWARIRSGGGTFWRSMAGGVVGALIVILALRFAGFIA